MDDILSDMVDWVIAQIVVVSGASATELKIDNNMLTAIQGIWDYFIVFGIGLTTVYFIIDLNKKWAFEGQSMTIKSLFIPFAKFVIAIILMAKAADLFGIIAGFNNSFADWSSTALATGSSIGTFLCPTCNENLYVDIFSKCPFCHAPLTATGLGKSFTDGLGFMQKMVMIFPCVIGWAVSVLCNLVWVYKALVYKIELLARIAFAPMALADCYSGMNSAALKYIKGTIALILYGGCMIILPKLSAMIALADVSNTMNAMVSNLSVGAVLDFVLAWFKIMIVPIAAIGLAGAAKTITKEALGA